MIARVALKIVSCLRVTLIARFFSRNLCSARQRHATRVYRIPGNGREGCFTTNTPFYIGPWLPSTDPTSAGVFSAASCPYSSSFVLYPRRGGPIGQASGYRTRLIGSRGALASCLPRLVYLADQKQCLCCIRLPSSQVGLLLIPRSCAWQLVQ